MMISYGGTDVTYKAGADLSSYQFCAVYLSAADTVSVQVTGNGVVTGILQNKPDTAGEEAIVRVNGTSQLKMNEAVAVDKHVTPANAAGGKGEVVDAADELYFARTLKASAAQNDLIPVVICDGYAAASEA